MSRKQEEEKNKKKRKKRRKKDSNKVKERMDFSRHRELISKERKQKIKNEDWTAPSSPDDQGLHKFQGEGGEGEGRNSFRKAPQGDQTSLPSSEQKNRAPVRMATKENIKPASQIKSGFKRGGHMPPKSPLKVGISTNRNVEKSITSHGTEGKLINQPSNSLIKPPVDSSHKSLTHHNNSSRNTSSSFTSSPSKSSIRSRKGPTSLTVLPVTLESKYEKKLDIDGSTNLRNQTESKTNVNDARDIFCTEKKDVGNGTLFTLSNGEIEKQVKSNNGEEDFSEVGKGDGEGEEKQKGGLVVEEGTVAKMKKIFESPKKDKGKKDKVWAEVLSNLEKGRVLEEVRRLERLNLSEDFQRDPQNYRQKEVQEGNTEKKIVNPTTEKAVGAAARGGGGEGEEIGILRGALMGGGEEKEINILSRLTDGGEARISNKIVKDRRLGVRQPLCGKDSSKGKTLERRKQIGRTTGLLNLPSVLQKDKKNKTVPQPFILATESRGSKKQTLFLEQLEEQKAREEAARIPLAQPLPYTIDEPEKLVKPRVKESVKVEPFDLKSLKRHIDAKAKNFAEIAAENEAAKKRTNFIARPITGFNSPILLLKHQIPKTEPINVVLNSDIRSKDRNTFDEEVAKKKEVMEQMLRKVKVREEYEDLEAIRILRQTMIPKARPVPLTIYRKSKQCQKK